MNIKSNIKTAGEKLVDLLADYGVDTVFGIPGTHSIELYRGLESGRIRHVSPRHEQGGGFMADGYARVTGKPGVCFVITGPGVTNISTPMGEAYMDSVPMLVISPVNDPDPNQVNRGRLHEITRQDAVTRPLAAISETVTKPEDIPEIIHRAFALFASERPRPVHVNIPLSVIPQPVLEDWTVKTLPVLRRASDLDIESVVEALGKASRPVIVAGGGTNGGAAEIQTLGEKICCPVLTTVAGRGVIPGDHPLSVGAQLRAPYVQEILEQADLAIFLGTEFAQTDHWNDDINIPHQQVWVNLCPHALERGEGALSILADCVDFAERLNAELPEPDLSRVVDVHEQCARRRAMHHRDFTELETRHWKVLKIIRDQVPGDVAIVSDMTQLAYTAVDYLPMQRPNQWLHPTGYGTLGYGLPAAIGAAIGNPETPVLVVVGDAGLQYTVQEMTLAAELELNIVVLLWNNDALQQIRDDMDNAGIERIGVAQKNPDFIALAKANHWAAWKVEEFSEIGADLMRGFDTSGPALIQLDESQVT